ncbi:MAG: hypothetical protein FJ404_14665 [Verrucomicrobia bacterium]|nr:hypothetical protein [Verrucomicrobiota bacterium]
MPEHDLQTDLGRCRVDFVLAEFHEGHEPEENIEATQELGFRKLVPSCWRWPGARLGIWTSRESSTFVLAM